MGPVAIVAGIRAGLLVHTGRSNALNPYCQPVRRTYAIPIRFMDGTHQNLRPRCIIYSCMPSFSQDIILFILGLLLFGPKKLPVLARQIGKWMSEFRRASNEFKMQMEEELRLSEQADRQAKTAAIEAAAPIPPTLPAPDVDPEDMHQRLPEPAIEAATHETESAPERVDGVRPLPIATSGELNIMPPATGLPVAQSHAALDPILESIPTTDPANEPAANSTEAAHGS